MDGSVISSDTAAKCEGANPVVDYAPTPFARRPSPALVVDLLTGFIAAGPDSAQRLAYKRTFTTSRILRVENADTPAHHRVGGLTLENDGPDGASETGAKQGIILDCWFLKLCCSTREQSKSLRQQRPHQEGSVQLQGDVELHRQRFSIHFNIEPLVICFADDPHSHWTSSSSLTSREMTVLGLTLDLAGGVSQAYQYLTSG